MLPPLLSDLVAQNQYCFQLIFSSVQVQSVQFSSVTQSYLTLCVPQSNSSVCAVYCRFFHFSLEKKYDLPPAGVIISPNVQCLKLHGAQPVCYGRWMRTQCFMKLLLSICRMTFSHSIPLKWINSFYTQGKKRQTALLQGLVETTHLFLGNPWSKLLSDGPHTYHFNLYSVSK